MAEFDDFDLEVQDFKDTTPEHLNITVTTAGTPITITRSDNKDITLTYIKNPNRGNRRNNISDVIYISIDGTDPSSYGTTISRGEYVYIPGSINSGNLKIDSNNNNTNVEIITWG